MFGLGSRAGIGGGGGDSCWEHKCVELLCPGSDVLNAFGDRLLGQQVFVVVTDAAKKGSRDDVR